MRIGISLSVVSLAMSVSVAHADPDARLTRTVLAQGLSVVGYQDELLPGTIWVDPNEIFLSPDGSRLAYLPASQKPDDLRHVVLDGKQGADWADIKNGVWSSGSRSFFYVGGAGKTETMVQNNAAAPPNSAFRGEKIDGVSAVDLPDASQSAVLYGIKKGGKILIDSNPAPADIVDVPTTMVLSPDSKDLMIEAFKDDHLSLWHGADFLGEVAHFPDSNSPFLPVWSPVGNHVAFAIEANGKPRLCVDATPLSDLAVRPKLMWNSTGTTLLAYGAGIPTLTFDFGGDGAPHLAKDVNESVLGDPAWSQNGTHFAFFGAQTGKIYVDGEAKSESNKYSAGEHDAESDPLLRTLYNLPSVAVSNDGHFASTSAWKFLMSEHTMTDLTVDGKSGEERFDKIFDLRWSEKLGRPIYLLLQGSIDEPTKTTFAVQLGAHDAIDLCQGLLANNWRPLGPLTLVTPDLARVVLLEGDKIVRYDIQLSPKPN